MGCQFSTRNPYRFFQDRVGIVGDNYTSSLPHDPVEVRDRAFDVNARSVRTRRLADRAPPVIYARKPRGRNLNPSDTWWLARRQRAKVLNCPSVITIANSGSASSERSISGMRYSILARPGALRYFCRGVELPLESYSKSG